MLVPTCAGLPRGECNMLVRTCAGLPGGPSEPDFTPTVGSGARPALRLGSVTCWSLPVQVCPGVSVTCWYLPVQVCPGVPVNPVLHLQSVRELASLAVSLLIGQLEHSEDPDLNVFFGQAEK